MITAEVDPPSNEAFGNSGPAMAFGPDGHGLHPLGWTLIDPGETPAATRSRTRERAFGGALAADLEACGLREPDRLARYLAGRGALPDLRRWFGLPNPDPGPEMTKASPPPSEGLFTLQPAGVGTDGEGRHRFTKASERGPGPAVWDAVAQHVLHNRPGTTLIAATGRQRDAIDTLVADLGRVNGFDLDAPGEEGVPSGRADLVQALGFRALRVGRPVDRDVLKRSEAALTGAPLTLGFLEPDHPVAAHTRWLRRLGFVARTPAVLGGALAIIGATFAAAILAGWVQGFEAPLTDPLGAVRHAVVANLLDLQLHDWLGLLYGLGTLVLTGGSLTALAVLLNHSLPGHLALRPRGRSGGQAEPSHPRRGRPWRWWVRRRVFGGGAIGVVVLRDVLEWADDDRDALHELVAMRRAGESLIVLLEVPSRGVLDRTVLRALTPAGADVPRVRFDRVQVCLGPEPAFLDTGEPQGTSDIDGLLGLDTKGDPMARERALAAIRDEGFSLADLLPTLSLGSTHHFPAFVTLPMAEGMADTDPELAARLMRFARLHAGRQDAAPFEPRSKRVDVDRWLAAARRATSVLLTRRDVGRRSFYDVLGRSMTRGAVAEALRHVFDGPGTGEADWIDYLRAALCCGELHALTCTRIALAPEPGAPVRPNTALAALRSARWLRIEHDRLGPSESERDRGRAAMVEAMRLEALDAIGAVRCEGDDHRAALARLYAIATGLGPTQAQDTPAPEPGSARAAFKAEVTNVSAGFGDLDHTLAQDRAMTTLRPLLAEMTLEPAAALLLPLGQRTITGRSLSELIRDASSADALRRVLRRHTGIAADAAATLLATAARRADTPERQVKLAEVVAGIDGAAIAAIGIGRPRGVSHGVSLPFDDLLTAVGELCDLLGTKPPDDGVFTITEMMLASTDPLVGTAGPPARIEFGHAGASVQSW